MRRAVDTHLAIAAVDLEGHAGRHEQKQGLLLRQLLLQSLHGLAGLVRPLWGKDRVCFSIPKLAPLAPM